VVWCGVVWCGVVWCGVVWCGVVEWIFQIAIIMEMTDDDVDIKDKKNGLLIDWVCVKFHGVLFVVERIKE